MKTRLMKVFLVVLASLVAMFVLAEVGFRTMAPRYGIDIEPYAGLGRYIWSGKGEFVPHPYSVFVRPPNVDRRNVIGFSEDRRFKKGDHPRILCLGGSTTEGGNPRGWEGSYPYMLLGTLESDYGIKTEVLNGGVSSWTSAETLAAYFLDYQDFLPDLVLLHHAVNDTEPMRANGFRVDYSHWRKPMEDLHLCLPKRALLRYSRLYVHLTDGVRRYSIGGMTKINDGRGSLEATEPNSQELVERTFARNIESIGRAAESNGSKVALLTLPFSRVHMDEGWNRTTTTNNRILREVAARNGWLLIDIDQEFVGLQGEQKELVESTFLDGVHLTAEGNSFKASYIAHQLVANGLLSPEPNSAGVQK